MGSQATLGPLSHPSLALGFQQLAEWHIDFVVLLKEHAIPTKQAEFSNAQYVVYRALN